MPLLYPHNKSPLFMFNCPQFNITVLTNGHNCIIVHELYSIDLIHWMSTYKTKYVYFKELSSCKIAAQ